MILCVSYSVSEQIVYLNVQTIYIQIRINDSNDKRKSKIRKVNRDIELTTCIHTFYF